MRWLVLAMAVGCLSACAGDSGTPSSSDRAAAPAASGSGEPAAGKAGCDLLTDAEVGAALGATIAGHEDSGLAGCRWSGEGGARLMLDVYAGSAMIASTCDAQKNLGTGREEPVEGLGDSAQWKTSGSLVVCSPRGVIRFNLDNSPRTMPENRAALITLARTVLERL
jgi:hypothetical protein